MALLCGLAVIASSAGLVLLLARSGAPASFASPLGGAVAVVRSGPAVLTAEPLTGGSAGRTISLPGTPSTMVTTPDGTKAFLLDSEHAQIVPVNLVTGIAGLPVPAGKLPSDERLSPDGATLLVTDNLSAAVIPIDTATNAARPALSIGVRGIASFVPSPVNAVALVTFFGSPGQPGSAGFLNLASGAFAAVTVGVNTPIGEIFSPDGNTVWVLESGVGSAPGVVIPIDVHAQKAGTPITVGHESANETMSSDGSTLVVTNTTDRSVSVLDLSKRAVVATVSVCAGPIGGKITADGATAWIGCALDQSLVPVDLHTYKAGAPVALHNAPGDLSIPRSGQTAWVLFPTSAGTVSFLHSPHTPGQGIPVGNNPNVVIAHDSSTAWVSNTLSDTVERLDISANTAGAAISVPRAPGSIDLSTDGKTLFVVSFMDGVQPGVLTAIDTTTSAVKGSLKLGVAPASLLLTPDGKRAFIANQKSDAVTTVDIQAWKVDGSIALPCSATGLGITPDGTTVFANCSDVSQIIPITASSRAVGPGIAVGGEPQMVMGNKGKLLFIMADHQLQVIDVATRTVTATQDETSNIVDMVPAPDDSYLLAVENTGAAMLTIDPTSLTITKSVLVGTRPDQVDVTPDGSRAYVLDSGEQKLYVVDPQAGKILATLDVSPNAQDVSVASLR